MIIDTKTLEADERVYLELRALYEQSGYRQFRMRKFEEYSLYLENKNFLGSEYVITFNAPDGKLLALKPDVTLSIVKNAKASGENEEKLYYRESVYRKGEYGGFKEISQMGLEHIGNVGLAETVEICALARKSLAVVDENYVFALSDMSFIGGLLRLAPEALQDAVLTCIRSRNTHELKALCADNGLSGEVTDKMLSIAGCPTDFKTAISVAEKVAEGDRTMTESLSTLKTLFNEVEGTADESKIRLDFSILNDIAYYNGIIFQGYVSKMPKLLLSGGRYDRLLEKFNKTVGAMGFALSLNDVVAYYNGEQL